MPPKVAARSSLEQIVILDSMLRQPIGASINEMQDRLGCCGKTVRRHLDWMARKLGCRFVRRVNSAGAANWRWYYVDADQQIFARDVARRFA